MDERITEIIDWMTKLEQRRKSPSSQAPSLAPGYADILRKLCITTNATQTPPPSQRFENFDYNSSKEKRRKKLFQVKVTHPAILNSSPDLEPHILQFFAEQLNIPGVRLMMECMLRSCLNNA